MDQPTVSEIAFALLTERKRFGIPVRILYLDGFTLAFLTLGAIHIEMGRRRKLSFSGTRYCKLVG